MSTQVVNSSIHQKAKSPRMWHNLSAGAGVLAICAPLHIRNTCTAAGVKRWDDILYVQKKNIIEDHYIIMK